MKFAKDKTAATIILLFAMAVSLIAIPTANAQPLRVKTFPFIGAVPNPVGVGQETLLAVGITMPLERADMGWEGLSITITRPDGTTETLSGIRTDSTGMTGRTYVPTMAGNYTLQAHFPEQVTSATKRAGDLFKGWLPDGTIMLASSSEKYTLVVQPEPIKHHPGFPLPAEYWTRPIDPQLREWASIAGNWLAPPPPLTVPTEYYVVGNEGPETAHILWTRPLTTGGLVGGALDNIDVTTHGFEEGDAYEGKFSQRFILGGKLYYESYAANDAYKTTVCVDIRTGEQLWAKPLLNNLTIARAQLLYWDTYNYHGVFDYLWATGNPATRAMLGFTAASSWHAFDPFTGDYVYTLHSLPTATATEYGSKGEILIYTIDLPAGWMTMWNSSNVPALYGSTVYASMLWASWRPQGKIVNATGLHGVTFEGRPFSPATLPVANLSGYQWNVTIPRGLPGSVNKVWPGDRIIGSSVSRTEVVIWAISLKPGEVGRLLFNTTWRAPALWVEGQIAAWGVMGGWTAFSQEEYIATLWLQETRENYAFCLRTGNHLWGPTAPQYYMDVMGYRLFGRSIAYGKFYSVSVSGVLYCYDVRTGKLLWTYNVEDPYSEILWANNWWSDIMFITDGKIYIAHYEHSPIDPKPRGAPFVCLNATTGEVIWRIDGAFRQTRWGGRAIIGDSVIVTMDTYDQRIYAIGKGPSAITVTAGPEVSVHGSSVLVKGMVTDVSPGTKSAALQMRFPHGVPAVADESMSDWMLYVYKQFPRPANVKGVEVVVSVLDPNGNCYEVGRTRSDENGYFGCTFTPPVPGLYKIIATFEGSKAYYGSVAETFINVEDVPPASPPPTPPPASIADMYFVPAVVGLLVAIIIVGALLALLLLRKR